MNGAIGYEPFKKSLSHSLRNAAHISTRNTWDSLRPIIPHPTGRAGRVWNDGCGIASAAGSI
jgi:hypothetical protein